MSSKTEIEIDGKNSGAILAINGVKQELNSLGNTIGGPFAGAMKSLGSYLSTGAILSSIPAFVALTKNAIDTADELSKMSEKVGISIESLSTLRYAAELSDLSMETFGTSLKKLSQNLYDVAHGQSKDAATAFNQIGISVTDTNGKLKNTEDVLLQVADRFAAMSDGTEKTALATKLFGRAGMELIPMLNMGASGINKLTKEAERLGMKIDTETGKAAEQFNDSLTTLKTSVTGLANQALPPLLNKLNNFTTGVLNLNNAVQDFSGESLFQGLYRAASNLPTMGIDLDKLTGINQMIHNYVKNFQELKQRADEVNPAFYDAFIKPTPLISNSIQLQNDEIKKQTESVKKLVDELSKLETAKAKGEPQRIASGAGSQHPLPEVTPLYEMFQVPENPFDPFQNYAINFFDMYDERALNLRMQTVDMFGNMGDAAAAFYQMSGQKSKEWFAIQKGFNIAQALMNTYEGATKALAQGGFFGIAMAATVIAAGLAQVANIASQQPGGGARSSGGVSSNNSLSQPNLTDRGTGNYNKEQNQIINIVFNAPVIDHDKFAREMVPAINRAVSDGVS